MKGLSFVIVLMIAATEGTTQFFLSPNKTPWQAANATCTVATPDITYSEQGYIVDVDMLELSHLNVATYSTQMWTDYTQAYYIFSYRGCVKENDVKRSHVANFTTRLEPAACFSACGKQGIIGIREDKSLKQKGAACFCFPISMVVANNKYADCIEPCQNPSSTACGATGFLSLYSTARSISVDQVVTLDSEEKSNCIAYEPISATYYWHRCSKWLVVTCVDGDQIKHHDITPWGQMAVRCFQDNMYPLSDVTAANIKRIPTNYDIPGTNVTLTWTNMFRSLVLSTRHDNVSHHEYGFLVKGEDTAYLEFSSLNKSTVALCQNDSDESGPTSEHTAVPDPTVTMLSAPTSEHTAVGLPDSPVTVLSVPTSEQTAVPGLPITMLSVLTAGSTKMTSSSTGKTLLGTRITQNAAGGIEPSLPTGNSLLEAQDTQNAETGEEQPVYVYVLAVAGVAVVAIIAGCVIIKRRRSAQSKQREKSIPEAECKNLASITPPPAKSDDADTLKKVEDTQLSNEGIGDQLQSDYDVVDEDIVQQVKRSSNMTEECKDKIKHGTPPQGATLDEKEDSTTCAETTETSEVGTSHDNNINLMNKKCLMATDDTYDHTNYSGKTNTVPNQNASTDNVYSSTKRMYGQGTEGDDDDETYDRTDYVRKLNKIADDTYDRPENVLKELENSKQESAAPSDVVGVTINVSMTNISNTNDDNVTGESGAVSGGNLAQHVDTEEKSEAPEDTEEKSVPPDGDGLMLTLDINVNNVNMSGSAEHIYIEM